MRVVLSLDHGKLVAYAGHAAPMAVLNSTADIDAVLAKATNGVFRSSSLDFPHEYTSDPAVLALVEYLNR